MQLKTLHRRKRKYILLILLLCMAGVTKTSAQIQGALNGVFSVSENTQVCFSQGNLQYQASTNTWRFAEHQWDFVGGTEIEGGHYGNVQGSSNNDISYTYSGWIDLFAWGTSGYSHGSVCYQPWVLNMFNNAYYAYGSYNNNLYDQTGQADWGYNAISNGGNSCGQWKTLSQTEWNYLLFERTTLSGMRYIRANVNGVNGLVLLPDNWNVSTYTLNGNANSSYVTNSINATDWMDVLEANGAVFLPNTGFRYIDIIETGDWVMYSSNSESGRYWTASYSDYYAACLYYSYYYFSNSIEMGVGSRYEGLSVRLVHVLQATSYFISTQISPDNGGTVTGAGAFEPNDICTLTAIPNEGYTFINWTENGEIVSTDSVYSFQVTANRQLVANFSNLNVGNGLLNGVFSVNENIQVSFSRGNLQYQASTNTWRFADSQWDYVGGTDFGDYHFGTVEGSTNNDISPTCSGWIDVFGWGTSGNNHGAVCYQPWGTCLNNSDYYAYGSPDYNLDDSTGQADWGNNVISNGGNSGGQWRTLNQDEWNYLLFERATISGMRYVLAKVNEVEGLILLPDTWDNSIYSLYTSVSISASAWINTLEPNGAVFLPAAGERFPEDFGFDEYFWRYVNWGSGHYWATTHYDNNDAYYMYFDYYQNSYPSDVSATTIAGRLCGLSVRLVKTIQPTSYNISTFANPFEGGSVTGAGEYEPNEVCTLTAIPNEGYTFINWTENGEMVSLEAVYSFTVTDNRSLVANFMADSQSYTISVSANPSDGGTVTGAGVFNQGETATLTAMPNAGYVFINWTKNGEVVSTNAIYSFTVTGNDNYVAHFTRLLPELHVTNVSHSAMSGGQQATISWTVKNEGTAPTPNGATWNDNVWLSVESCVNTNFGGLLHLGTFENISALNVGESYTQTQTFNIPIDYFGDCFLFVITDAYDAYQINLESNELPIPYNPPPYISCYSNGNNVIYELSEYEHGYDSWGYYNDNFFYELVDIAVPLVPDLQVTSIIAPNNFFSGSEVNVTATISNLGEVTTLTTDWTDALFFSTEPDFSSAICLAVKNHTQWALPVGESYQVTFRGEIPLTAYGDGYFFVMTDVYEQVYEHVLNHNNVTMSDAVNVILTPPADLVPSDVNVPVAVSTSGNLSYSYTITNNGAGHDARRWVDRIYLCQNGDTLDATAVFLQSVSHNGGALWPSMSITINRSITLPTSLSSGFYYLYVVVDADNDIFEYLYEDNNVAKSSPISITSPDLQITQITAPGQITSGYPINLTYTIANNGDGAITNRSITDKVYISQTESLSGAIQMASLYHNINLSVGQNVTFTCNQTAPTGLTDGTYHLIVVTDANSEIYESNENNNTFSQYPMPVMHQPLPDLQPVSLVLPEVIQAGEAVTVTFDITNNGDLDLLNSNCTFNIYATWSNQEVLCPVQSQTLPLGSSASIGIEQTVHFVRSIHVPASVPSTCTTFKLYVDKENHITELNESNNHITTNTTVLDCPLPDLTVYNITFPAIQAGTEAQVSFSVSNAGTIDFNGGFGMAIYAVVNGNQTLCPLQQQIAPATSESYNLPVGGSLTFSQKVLVPPTVTASCNTFRVIVDDSHNVLESNEDNNSANVSAMVQDYAFNLTTQSLNFAATVTAGEITNVSWTVKNTGTCPSEQIPFYIRSGGSYTIVEGEYLPTPWIDKIYLSNDAVLDNNDTQLLSIGHNTVLNPNGTYSVEQTITLPYSAVGSKYLLCVSDAEQITFDNNRTDNVVAVPVTVELGALPDLRITSLIVDEVMTSDRAYWVHYTVINEGERVTQKNSWTEAFFIGENMAYIDALQIGTKIHYGALEVGESYTDSIEILLPNGLEGDYFLIGIADRTDQIYEHNNEDDNVLAMPVTIMAPAPCDLIAVQPEFPAVVVSGEEMTVSWQLRNIGLNPAVGRVRNAVYLSTDAEWSNDDVMLDYGNTDINLATNAEQTCSLSGILTNYTEGNYYVIVKVNILNALNEASYENNICVSMMTAEISFPLLAIGETINRSMSPEQCILYKIPVGSEYEGKTLVCHLESLDHEINVYNEWFNLPYGVIASNGFYLSYESVPTPMTFDYGESVPYSYEQEIIVPELKQGTYYLMVQGFAFTVKLFHQFSMILVRDNDTIPEQNISISTSIRNFEILHIDADHGSNTGSITTKVTGAKFDSIMDFRLVQGGEYLPAEKVFFSNSTETYTTFDLVDMPAGTYAMEAELPGGIITIKGEAFTIEEGLPAELAVNIVAPSSVRRGNTFPVNIEYGNIGTTDLNVSGFVVVSRNGHPIGFTSDELAEGLTERVFSTAEANGNPDVLRPGYRATKTILVDANTLTSVSLQVYAIRKQY